MPATAVVRSHHPLKRHLALALATVAGLCAGMAVADPIPAGEIKMDALRSQFTIPGGGSYRAGEFVVNASRLTFNPSGLGKYGAESHQYISFCVELTELIQLNKWYDAELNTESRSTKSSAKPLQSQTAFLYTQFINGDLDGYSYFDAGGSSSEKTASARALQELIWYFQDQTSFEARYGSNAFGVGGYFNGAGLHHSLARAWYEDVTDAIDGHLWSGIGKVRIINIWDGLTGRQDTLAMIPLPAPVWLGGVGLAGVVVWRTRRRRPTGDGPFA